MTQAKRIFLATLACLALNADLPADVLELKNGTLLNGKYEGGSAGTLRFQTGAGVQVISIAEVIALTFTTPVAASAPVAVAPSVAPSAPASATAAAPQPVAAPAPSAVSLPAGTMLLVRMMDSISSRNAPGATFTTKLEYDLVVNNVKAVPAGTIIYGRVQSATQARRAVGKSTLDVRLVQMVVGGTPSPVSTSGYKEAGEASIKKAARGAAAGAAIGAIAGDAGKGAAIGASAGALRRGETVTITPGTLLEFNLTQPVRINVAR
jgi:hypothetical protein